MNTRLIGLVVILFACIAAAQEQDHLSHHRHEYKHNPPHPAAVDKSRFFTNRSSGVDLPLPDEQDAFFFVIFGDRTGGPVEGVSVLADAVYETNLLEPDLVMTVGDLVQGYNRTEPWLVQMREFKSIMNELLCPWFPVAGNHDVYWRGEGRPKHEHDADYEMYFGPLWYAFTHKNNGFIVLYSDEGNPDTGEKNFEKPECQRMSDEQFQWLGQTLDQFDDLDHVFLFLHHPRWLENKYGDDWEHVHRLLVDAGNVSAVFAGHIHRMRYDGPKDGIEYVTLATVGGAQSAVAPEAGYLHQFHIVTVRKDQIALSAVPVGGVMDVRDLTGVVSEEAGRLARLSPAIEGPIAIERDGSAAGTFKATLLNPTSRPVEVTLTPGSADSRWVFMPDHVHELIEPGLAMAAQFRVARQAGPIDASFRGPMLDVEMDYLAEHLRYAIPESSHRVPMLIDMDAPARPAGDLALDLDGHGDCLRVEPTRIELPADSPLTLECRFNADRYANRTGLVCKTESSDYGIFVNKGVPEFSIHIGGGYLIVTADQPAETGAWHHVAGVYDGAEARLYVDGRLVASKAKTGERRTNALPMYVGADVTGDGSATSLFDGRIDDVRLSSVARYTGDRIDPEQRFEPDNATVLLLNMDGFVGPWLYDESIRAAHPECQGDPELVPVKD